MTTNIPDKREEAMGWRNMYGGFLIRTPPHQCDCGSAAKWLVHACHHFSEGQAFPLVNVNGVALVFFYLLLARFQHTLGPATGQRDN
jgi:hypothetical protein